MNQLHEEISKLHPHQRKALEWFAEFNPSEHSDLIKGPAREVSLEGAIARSIDMPMKAVHVNGVPRIVMRAEDINPPMLDSAVARIAQPSDAAAMPVITLEDISTSDFRRLLIDRKVEDSFVVHESALAAEAEQVRNRIVNEGMEFSLRSSRRSGLASLVLAEALIGMNFNLWPAIDDHRFTGPNRRDTLHMVFHSNKPPVNKQTNADRLALARAQLKREQRAEKLRKQSR